jgi:hypothetical protein
MFLIACCAQGEWTRHGTIVSRGSLSIVVSGVHARISEGANTEGDPTMNSIKKFLLMTVAAGGLALAAPANAQVSVGVGIGGPGPGYHHPGCYNHPRACGVGAAYVGGPGVGVAVGVPAVGVYVGGRGYWDGHGWYAHRYWGHGGWRYR